MLVRILGSAAGGAFPQWNCLCANCRSLRAGNFRGRSRSQTQVALSEDGNSWFLLGASPDLRAQMESITDLHPRDLKSDELTHRNIHGSTGVRQSPIAGVVLANADLDHVLGLLLLRELQPLAIYATASIRRILNEDNSMFGMLHRIANQAAWIDFTPGQLFELAGPAGHKSGIRCRALSLGTHYPAYVSPQRQAELIFGEASLGLILESPSGKRLAYMPAVPQIDDALLKEFESVDVLLFDGTFWSDDELIRIQGSGQTALQMGHVPISSSSAGLGSLSRLAGLQRPRKIYLHINNTNPILNESGPEYREVRDSGWEVAEDGWKFEL